MPGIRTIDALVTQVRRRADMENSSFVTDDEIKQYIQDSYGELWDLIIESAGDQHFVQAVSFQTSPGVEEYRLSNRLGVPPPYVGPEVPLKVYRTLGVSLLLDNEPYPVRPGSLSERHMKDRHQGWSRGVDISYVVHTVVTPQPIRTLAFFPPPLGVHDVGFFYIPYPADLTGDGSSSSDFTLQGYTGWDEFVVCDAAAKCLEKEESDSRHLLARKMMAADRIRWAALNMNQETGGRVRNVDAERRQFWRRF